ncbi:NERD domain-containing protein [Chloroflexota bacterium]
MATMIPAVLAENTRSSAERRLFPILREGLDDSFTVFHSFDLLVQNRQGKFIDGEIDFLIFHPKLGFLVLEVKGGSIGFDGEQGTWYQNDIPVKKSPFAQAENSKYKLGGFLRKRLGHAPGCTFAHAVCFPDISGELKGLPSGADAKICITGRQLAQIDQVIPNIMSSFHDHRDRPVTQDDVERIRQVLMPHCEYSTNLQDRMVQAEEVVFRLTENQCRILDYLNYHRHALIEGCAGSGKTIMAVKKARTLALEGNSVLLLAYNVMLGKQLAAAVSDLDNVTASNYHRFCMDHLKEAGISPEPDGGSDFWQRQVPEAFAKLVDQQPIKYDAVIVDEGQDFHIEYWLTITELVNDTGFFYIFYDPGQNLWGIDLDFPISKEPFILDENCRNTRSIFDKLEPHSKTKMRLHPDAPEGEPIVEYTIRDDGMRRRRIGKILYDLVNNKEIERERIVILGGHSMNHTCIGENPVIGTFRITETTEDDPNAIHYHTYMKFKGCEADAVIMIDVDRNDERWAKIDALYTTISRAKHLLYILYSEGENNAG